MDPSPAKDNFEGVMEEITNTALALNGNHLEYFNDLTFEKFADCHEALSKANWD